MKALPDTVKIIAVLDRTKEPGCAGEPLYQDVVTAISEGMADGDAPFDNARASSAAAIGLSSKEFTPAMVKGIFDEMAKDKPKNHFTVGINDDVTYHQPDLRSRLHHRSRRDCPLQSSSVSVLTAPLAPTRTRSRSSVKKPTTTPRVTSFTTSKKSGSVTISHLRFGPKPIRAPYLIGSNDANFVACHQFSFLEQYDMLKYAKPGGIFLLNSLYGPEEVWDHLPCEVQKTIIDKETRNST